MKVVVAPDGFGGTLTAVEAAAAMAEGWRRARPGDDVVIVPMADGGEGTLDVVAAAVAAAERVPVEVADARGRARAATWLRLPDGRALVESAEACGTRTIAPHDRDPLLTTTYGVGQLLAHSAASGATEVVVGLGGSATVDGGAGMATSLGHRLLRADGNGVKVGGAWVGDVARVVRGPRLAVPVVAAADVRAPLLGGDGAARRFGPQKGASPAAVEALEAALTTFADVVERDVEGGPWRDVEGAGAAGGLGFALLAFCGAMLVEGAAIVADLVGLPSALRGADVVITGEGALDAGTGLGKVVAHVARAADAAGVGRALAVVGRHDGPAPRGIDVVAALGPDGPEHPVQAVAARTAELAASA